MTAPLDAATIRRRFLVLVGLRWLPVGAVIPVLVLLMQDRGLGLAEIGLATAVQGFVVLLFELPTGGFADALGRRPVMLVAAGFELAAVALLIVATDLPVFAAAFALEGVYRALQSGPLESWYVDASQAADPRADIEGGLARAGVVTGVAIAAGSLAGGGLVAWDPVPATVDALLVPLLFSLVFRVVETVALAVLMVEVRRPRGAVALRAAVADVPQVITGALGLIRRSRWLFALVTVELLWGAGMFAFEMLLPPKLAEVVGTDDGAAALLGPVGAVAWLANAAGAAAVPRLSRRFGADRAGALLRVLQGATTLAMGLAGGVVGVIAGFLATYAVHGAANPVHQGLLHRAVGPDRRTTVASANSMMASIGGAVGGIGLGALADGVSVTAAIAAGAVLLAIAAPLYLVTRDRPTTPNAEAATSSTT